MKTPLLDGDYLLEEGAGWFEVDEYAVRICLFPHGLKVDVCKNGDEFDGELDSMFVPRQ